MTDKEYLDRFSTIEIYAEILLGILRYTDVGTYQDETQYKIKLTKKLKFEKITDFELFRACIDLLEDTQFAIKEIYEFGLETKSNSHGEKYLRLYGALNATYLQLGAILDLIRLFNIPNQKEIKSRLKSLKIIEIRNKIGSHTTNYSIPNTERETNFFKIAQTSIHGMGKNLLIVGKNDHEKIDLIINMKQFTKEIESILEVIISKELYSRAFNSECFEWLKYRHDYIKKYRN